MKHTFIGICLLLLSLEGYCQSQTDSLLTISFEEAKGRLFKENLQLIAAYYDVNIAEAELTQAKTWRNPYLVWNQDLYSIEKNQYFNYKLQQLIQIEYVFSVAGKYTNTVKLGKLGVEMSKLQFADVMRSLMFDLTAKYTSLSTAQQSQLLYESILKQYDTTLKAAEIQLKTGSIAGNEVIRLRSEAMAIQTVALDNKNEVEQAMSEVRILLNLPKNVRIQTTPKNIDLNKLEDATNNMIAISLENRPDFKLSQMRIEYEKQNLKLQKSTAIPDMKLGYQPRDKGSNYVRPYSGLVFEMFIPIFDRNQGDIKLAKAHINQAAVQFKLKENEIANEVMASYNQLVNVKNGLEKYDKQFLTDLETFNVNTNQNFNKRTINLLEFIDQQRIYIQTKTQLIELQRKYMQSINQLNFNVGKDIIY